MGWIVPERRLLGVYTETCMGAAKNMWGFFW